MTSETTTAREVDVPKQPWVKTVWTLTALLVVAIIAVTALAYGYVGERNSSEAKTQSLRIAKCVNNVLALRQTPASADTAAYQAIFNGINQVIVAPNNSDEQEQAFVAFEKILAANESVLNQDQAFRASHPLGVC